MPSIMALEGPKAGKLSATTRLASVAQAAVMSPGRMALWAIGGAALIGVAWIFMRHERRGLRGPSKRKPKDKFTVFDYEIDPNSGSTTRIRESINTATPGDYGADPIGPNSDGVFMFRMVPSGDVVDSEERERRLKARKGLRGPSMLQVIASEARTPEEFARRAEAWNAAEREPLPVTRLAKAYKKASPSTVARLIREAHETRVEGRERLWSRMSKGLRSNLAGYRVAYGTSDGKKTFRVFDERVLDKLEHAEKLRRSYKRQGYWAWIEDEEGNFVPVPGAKSERVRKSYPPR